MDVSTTGSGTPGAIPARIDRLPMSRELWRILLLAGIAWLVESYDIGVIGNVLPSLEKAYTLSTFEIGLLATASTLGIVVAIVPAGRLADAIGRKRVLILGTIWYSVFTLLCGFAPSPSALVALRIVAGLGMGAMFPIPYALASEMTPRYRRGAMTGVLDSFLSVGYFLAPLTAFAVVPHFAAGTGWRYLFFLGALPILYVPVMMRWMPESPRWLLVKGRDAEANRIVTYLEDAAERRSGHPLAAPVLDDLNGGAQASATSAVATRPNIFRKPYLRRTLMMWVSFSCILFMFYAVQTYTPTVLVKQGYKLGDAFLLTSIIVIASIPGKYLEAYAVERFGRKKTLMSFTLLAAASAVVFGFSHVVGMALGFGILLSFFGIGVDPAIKIYGAEQYPTAIRETGISWTECVGRFFGGVAAPFIMAFVLARVGIPGSYLFVAGLAIVGAIVVGVYGTETRGASLEAAAAAQSPSPIVPFTTGANQAAS